MNKKHQPVDDGAPAPGKQVTASWWLTGEETEHKLAEIEFKVKLAIGELCDQHGVLHSGELRKKYKRPGDEGCPPVPDHIKGIDVRLMIMETDIIAYGGNVPVPEYDIKERRFVRELRPADLAKLRRITQQAYLKANPGAKPLSNERLDDVIETQGPVSVQNEMMRRQNAPSSDVKQ